MNSLEIFFCTNSWILFLKIISKTSFSQINSSSSMFSTNTCTTTGSWRSTCIRHGFWTWHGRWSSREFVAKSFTCMCARLQMSKLRKSTYIARQTANKCRNPSFGGIPSGRRYESSWLHSKRSWRCCNRFRQWYKRPWPFILDTGTKTWSGWWNSGRSRKMPQLQRLRIAWQKWVLWKVSWLFCRRQQFRFRLIKWWLVSLYSR